MTPLQSQYMLCPPLACYTVPTRLDIDSINRRIRSYGILPILAQKPAVVLQSLRRWLTTAYASIQIIQHKCPIGLKSGDLGGKGNTVTFWLARKSTVERTMCGWALCWKPSLQRFIAGSMCGFKNLIFVSSGAKVAGNVHQLRFSCVAYGTPHHHTSSAGIVDPKDTVPCEPLIPASVDTCTAISFLQHEYWFIAESDSPPV
jgi:hypothetical protein